MKHITLALSLVLAGILSVGCGTFNKLYNDRYEKLGEGIRIYNDAFESKRSDICLLFIQPDMREPFIKKFGEIKNHVTFDQSEIVSTEFFKKGYSLDSTNRTPENDFDEAEVTLRYQVVVLPSSLLKTVIVRQKWVLENSGWFVIPDLHTFFD